MRTLKSNPCRPKFLCNTSGSGKTRLLLEGLSRHWNYYFTARTKPDGVGFKDLESILHGLKSRLNKIADGGLATALDENEQVAYHRFRLLLYVRHVCSRVFLECAAAMESGTTGSSFITLLRASKRRQHNHIQPQWCKSLRSGIFLGYP